jgi:L-lactate dehydrogenase (cytochrome)
MLMDLRLSVNAGVTRAPELLQTDLESTLKLLGCASMAALDRSYIQVSPSWPAD